jgi:hypothetical protein
VVRDKKPLGSKCLPDLNCTHVEDKDGGTIHGEGESAAHEDANARQDKGDNYVVVGVSYAIVSYLLLC